MQLPQVDKVKSAIVVPVGPGRDSALDTLDSIESYCPEPHLVVIVDDHKQDGTYEALVSHKRANWRILRNSRPMGCIRLVHSLCAGGCEPCVGSS